MKRDDREKRAHPDREFDYEEWKEGRRPRIEREDMVALFPHANLLKKEGDVWVLHLNDTEYRCKTKRGVIWDWWITQGYAIDNNKKHIGLVLVNFKMRDDVQGTINGSILKDDTLEAQEIVGQWWLVTKWTRAGVELTLPEPEAWANALNGTNIQDITPKRPNG